MRNLSIAFLFVIAVGAFGAEPMRLLEVPDAWERIGGRAESFVFDDGTLRVQRAGAEPAELLSKADYENFELSFEFTVARWAESGLFLLAPRNRAYRAGLELELADTYEQAPSPYVAGALFRKAAPSAGPIKDDGEWNTCSIRLDWPMLTVTMNGVTIHDCNLEDDEATKHLPRRGAIGFQNLGYGLTVRNFIIQPLPDTEKGIVMIKGDSLDGWEDVRGHAKWENAGGIIRGFDGDGYLRHEAVAEDFDLRGYVRTDYDANGGIFFRWPSGEPKDRANRGHEIQILDMAGSKSPTGTIYNYARGNDLALTPGEWTFLQIIVRGARCTTYVNGIKSAATDDLAVVRPGHITLQMHRLPHVEFRDLVLIPKE